ncbi:AER281Cp [Eremothecium gossypii ATCC 10895]|uniref:AER281Cp n=1 Tax=Eremothecium gossypii (strain ATCC 10895 / CBS 109.51 / FGSC 9923 / NRRL Y-1056) TaxID=284811 RepID=Q756I0_EREGS|nr:AER281Cp [Eremothecium gossypii ATCC 10895]AAS52962.1 AER281Cp [Eremothecium gossypii ATCC 10895]AEY97270.1 FAER281Cp [Eremothecium gossypii FDAG1]
MLESSQSSHKVLRKWNSCAEHLNLPAEPVAAVRRLHIYDFDNTLFKSPAPNPNILAPDLVRALVNCERFSNGGWWSERRFLAAAVEEWEQRGSGADKEFWNLDVVALAHLSAKERGTVSVLMTGRREVVFSELIGELLRRPVDGECLCFNAVLLKKEGHRSTLAYKTACMKDLLDAYPALEEITIYDDRPWQLAGFRTFLNEYVTAVNNRLTPNLVHIPGEIRYLEPRKEVAIITAVVEEHNRDVDLLRNGRQKKLPGKSYFYLEKASIREVISFVGHYITIESRKRIMEHITQNFTHVFGSTNEELDQYVFDPSFIPATKLHTLPSKVMVGQFIVGRKAYTATDEAAFARYAEEFNDLKTRVYVQFRLKRFGKVDHSAFYVEVEPVPPERIVKSDSVETTAFYLGQRVGSQLQSSIHDPASFPESIEWEDIEQEVYIDTELQYNYKYHLCSFKKHRKQKHHK